MTEPFVDFITAFRAVVAKQPDHPAIVTDGAHIISYAQLDLYAQNIANTLPEPSGQLIGIQLKKSVDYIASMLACWYAGHAFIPLDPELPDARRDFILKDAAPAFVIRPDIVNNAMPRSYAPKTLSAQHCAYVIYTSGSTGQPKGVVVPHRGLVSMLKCQVASFSLTPNSRSLSCLSISFDASISDFGTALLSGAALYIEQSSRIDLAARMGEIIAQRQITFVDIAPSLLRLLDPATCGSLQTIVIGGEICPLETVKAWAGRVNLINVYGPTEATICTSLCRCHLESWQAPLIGTPLPDVEYYIYDENMNPTDQGELYIAGAQLADGYLNRPELTALKFIEHGAKRLYRSGDHVARHANGDIEFLGRIDRQFKINGQLAEPEEIESALCAIAGITRAAVIKEKSGNRDQLVAFVKIDKPLSDTFIRAKLSGMLPLWMLPAKIHRLDVMPQTSSGKVDYAALKMNETPVQAIREDAAFRPQTAADAFLLQTWQRILKTRDIRENDHFFDLGGDSLALLDLCLSCERHGYPLSPEDAMKYPQISTQALLLTRAQPENAVPAQYLRSDVAPDHELLNLCAQASARPPATAKNNTIFMTGATGFLGGRMLQHLLETTTAQFTLLLRAKTVDDGWDRLSLPDAYKPRVDIVLGDIEKRHFGLARETWDNLCHTMDTVIHSAATVNMAKSYADLREVNVTGTRTALELALQGKRKALHYMSTLSVFVSTDAHTGVALENDKLHGTKHVYGGYAQSKWAAEVILHSVPSRSCDIYIYRLGLVTGDSTTGLKSSHDFVSLFTQGLEEIGSLPEGDHESLMVDVTPVDYAVRACTALIQHATPGTYHIANISGFSLAQIADHFKRNGTPLSVLPWDRWKKRGQNTTMTSSAAAAAFMALCRLGDADFYTRHRAMDLFQATDIRFDMTQTERFFKEPPPAADNLLLEKYLIKEKAR